jgi:hypothetical protein
MNPSAQTIALASSLPLEIDAAPGELDDRASSDLRRRTAEGVVASVVFQVTSLVLRVGSMIVLARWLTPEDFGLVGMVTALTGFLELFKDAGLSNATVQSATINQDQLSMLFWINVAAGCTLALLSALGAPMVAGFYGEPRLIAITLVLGSTFVFTGLAAQHRAILQRDLQIRALAAIDILSLVAAITVSLVMANAGLGYWALVATATLVTAGGAIGSWIATGWLPGRPRRTAGVRRLITYGGTITVNSVVVYLAYNIDKVLIGRFWGAPALGIYGRAYQLLNLPTNTLHSTVGTVAFPALSRLQNDPPRLRRYFLTIYGLFLAVSLPVTAICGFFAEDVVLVLLGPRSFVCNWQGRTESQDCDRDHARDCPRLCLGVALWTARRGTRLFDCDGRARVAGHRMGHARHGGDVARCLEQSCAAVRIRPPWDCRGTVDVVMDRHDPPCPPSPDHYQQRGLRGPFRDADVWIRSTASFHETGD